ncbi:MAG: hypothetical protein M3Y86_08815 [Verrucomicrobiota bacterium]|nr:hypothetical protein [Verrucomicrobiota bacterium]
MISPVKAALFSLLHVIAATVVYWHLITGGWLTNTYQLGDANIVNLLLAIFEPIAVVSVIVYWLGRTRVLYRIMSILALAQILIGLGFLLFLLLFVVFWHPKMM